MHDDLSLACKYCKWEPITEFEITVAMRTWSRKKATGPEQISFEALRAMTQDPHWSKRILQMVNDCFYKASFPEELLTGATILLPKARWWLQLIQATSITFHVEGEQVTIPQSNGVRQRCPDSPVLFAAAIGEKMGATAEDFADPPG
eukprot:s2062_g25.t1